MSSTWASCLQDGCPKCWRQTRNIPVWKLRRQTRFQTNETSFHHFQSESKLQSKQRKYFDSPPLKKSCNDQEGHDLCFLGQWRYSYDWLTPEKTYHHRRVLRLRTLPIAESYKGILSVEDSCVDGLILQHNAPGHKTQTIVGKAANFVDSNCCLMPHTLHAPCRLRLTSSCFHN
jgi:hypothetical protein